MKCQSIARLVGFVTLLVSTFFVEAALPLKSLHVPSGFSLNVYAKNLPGVRELSLGPHGVVFAGSKQGNVYALTPDYKRHIAKHIYTIASGLNHPAGVAYIKPNLYIGEIDKIDIIREVLSHLRQRNQQTTWLKGFPQSRHHGLRYLLPNKDKNSLIIGIGMPCNVCLPAKPTIGTLLSISLVDKVRHVIANGLRNSEGFTYDKYGRLWFTDNGQDGLGDNVPPDEVNLLTAPPLNYGFPYVYGNNVPNKLFYDKRPSTEQLIPPEVNLPAHVAPLGMTDYESSVFPRRYRHSLLIAEHGSWNRTNKVGYQVVWLKKEKGRYQLRPLVWGWLHSKTQAVSGRPVDVLVIQDGSVLISDDYAGVIYRLSYKLKRSNWA